MVDKPLSVIQLNSIDYFGGAEAIARHNHVALQQLGHKSQLIVGKKIGTDAAIEQLTLRPGFLGSRRIAKKLESITGLQYTYSPSFRQVSKQFGFVPDVVHIHNLHGSRGWADLIGVAKLTQKYPIVLSLHDLWWLSGHCAYQVECERWKTGCGNCPDLSRYPAVPKDGTRWNWKRKKRLFSKRKQHFIAASEWVRAQANRSPILKDCSIHVVPNPIDTQVFKPGDKRKARDQLHIPADIPVVLVAASDLNSRFKGIGDAIEVLNDLKDLIVFAILVGRNSDEWLKRLSVPSKALGYIKTSDKMAECYRAADVFIFPSRVETFGLVAAEAVACGTAVVGYKAGGLEEVMKIGHGIAVQDYSVKDLLAATRHLLLSENYRKDRVASGQLRVVKAYSPQAHATGCLQVYKQAIADVAH